MAPAVAVLHSTEPKLIMALVVAHLMSASSQHDASFYRGNATAAFFAIECRATVAVVCMLALFALIVAEHTEQTHEEAGEALPPCVSAAIVLAYGAAIVAFPVFVVGFCVDMHMRYAPLFDMALLHLAGALACVCSLLFVVAAIRSRATRDPALVSS